MQEKQETQVPPLGREGPLDGKWPPPPVSCLENPTDRGAWRATVPGVAGSRTRPRAQGADKERQEREDRSRQGGLSNNGRAGLFYLQTVSSPCASVPTVDASRTVLPWA